MKKIIVIVLLGLCVYGIYLYFDKSKDNKEVFFVVEEMDTGVVVQTVSATGQVEPITLVKVGSQVSGRIEKIFADFNSRVTANQIICEIDKVPLLARVSQDKANLARNEARLEGAQANRDLAKLELGRSQLLDKDGLISKSELDKERYNVKTLEAQVKLAEAELNQAKASLEVSEANLNFATIRSPVNGIVILRNVDVGQTVAASFQAPVLFEIAQNLEEVHVLAAVGEADIGMIKNGQVVNFEVDAYPDTQFEGKVLQVRLAPNVQLNVVTYTVVISANNQENKLFPGMTANLFFEIGRSHKDDLRVSNAALRFEPKKEWINETIENVLLSENKNSKSVWVLEENGFLKQVVFQPGYSDRSYTQVLAGDVKETLKIVKGVQFEIIEENSTTNPFMARRRSKSKSKKK